MVGSEGDRGLQPDTSRKHGVGTHNGVHSEHTGRERVEAVRVTDGTYRSGTRHAPQFDETRQRKLERCRSLVHNWLLGWRSFLKKQKLYIKLFFGLRISSFSWLLRRRDHPTVLLFYLSRFRATLSTVRYTQTGAPTGKLHAAIEFSLTAKRRRRMTLRRPTRSISAALAPQVR